MNQSVRVPTNTANAIAAAVEQMPIVKALIGFLKADGFSFDDTTRLFGVQHLMEQSLVFCWALRELGLSYDRMALAGKPYSTNVKVVEQLSTLGVMVQEPREYDLARAQAQEQIEDIRRLAGRFADHEASLAEQTVLIVDDGGHALSHFKGFVRRPYRLAGVEQTASGFWQPGFHRVPFPIVDVGASAVKRICEPPVIAAAAIRRVENLLAGDVGTRQIGIVGLGYIGTALYNALAKRGLKLLSFDDRLDSRSQDTGGITGSLKELFDRSDVVFGCTGADFTRSMILDEDKIADRSSERLLISLSSGDDEFFSLKAELLGASKEARHYQLGCIPDICGEHWGVSFRIVRNGFPINFDNSGTSVPLAQIQGTIAALVAATCQSYMSARNEDSIAVSPQRTMLDTKLQRWLFRQWQPSLPNLGDVEMTRMQDLGAIVQLSTERTSPQSVQIEAAFGDWTEH